MSSDVEDVRSMVPVPERPRVDLDTDIGAQCRLQLAPIEQNFLC
jgi:hypothetical protein